MVKSHSKCRRQYFHLSTREDHELYARTAEDIGGNSGEMRQYIQQLN